MVENLECRRFRNRIDAYLDNELSASEREEMRRHAGACAECGRLLKEYEDMRAMLAELDREIDIPPEAAQAWRSRVRDECGRRRARRRFGWPKAVAVVAASVAVLVGVTTVLRSGLEARYNKDSGYRSTDGYYAAGDAGYAYESDAYFASPMEEAGSPVATGATAGNTLLERDGVVAGNAGSAGSPQSAARMPIILRTASRTIQSTEFDAALERLDALVASSSGWFEYRSVSGSAFVDGGRGRSLSGTARVPADELDAFLAALAEVGSVTAVTDRAEDVSDRYYDTQTRLNTLRTEYERLTDLVTDAASLEELLILEDKIGDVQYRIDSLEGELANLNSRASFSSVSIVLEEVRKYVEPVVIDPTLGERISKGFMESIASVREFLQDMLVALASSFVPALVVILPAGLIVWLVVRSIRRRRRK